MRNGVIVIGNLRFNTMVGYDIKEVNKFLLSNPDYGLLDADDELKVYHCAKLEDEGEVYDKKKPFDSLTKVKEIINNNVYKTDKK